MKEGIEVECDVAKSFERKLLPGYRNNPFVHNNSERTKWRKQKKTFFNGID